MNDDVRLVPIGDSCLSMLFGRTIDPAVNARCVAMAASLERRAWPGVRDVVPAYNAVTVHFDPIRFDREDLATELNVLAAMDWPEGADAGAPVMIPVTYGGEDGPDLSTVAKFAGCSEDEVIRLHAAPVYRVYMLGFLPGFAYMGSVNARIAMPRLDTPRMRVAAGSVGIAGLQTGVYPCETPGGWRIIGRTPIRLFDSARATPCVLKAGDRVRFVAA